MAEQPSTPTVYHIVMFAFTDTTTETMIKDLNIANANVVTLTVGDELSGAAAPPADAEGSASTEPKKQ